MKKTMAVLLCAAMLMTGCGSGSSSDKSKADKNDKSDSAAAEDSKEEFVFPSKTADYPSLKDVYADDFYVGSAVAASQVVDPDYVNLIKEQFNSMTCENEMKPDALLDKDTTLSDIEKYRECPAVKFDKCIDQLEFAKANGIKMRGHTLIWYSQTPEWLFYKDYDTSGELADRELMLKRMENYIKTVFEWADSEYPGLFYAWDVVNEAAADGQSAKRDCLWLQTIGDDYIEKAFEYARKYQPEGVKLYYNDYNAFNFTKQMVIIDFLKPVAEAGNIDGVGMQSHIGTWCDPETYATAVRRYNKELGVEISITELDISKDNTDEWEENQGEYSQRFMEKILELKEEGIPIPSFTIWGLTDGVSWKKQEMPLFFSLSLKAKPAFFGLIAAKAPELAEGQ
ncbi:endo-1,4-beta-xylanase [Ruminococcus sp.]|uniref:endo-1,4-beta-xylanase n=1 Tax=Ruminococcus sp. TaxID=41978 RepID=UPI0025E93EEC|nr:endo-1,4-beta-xylanase [Ruminococcus sp.]MBQ8966657.1 endo-1,4-beta-xylanase [Ruminococcus sp.]